MTQQDIQSEFRSFLDSKDFSYWITVKFKSCGYDCFAISLFNKHDQCRYSWTCPCDVAVVREADNRPVIIFRKNADDSYCVFSKGLPADITSKFDSPSTFESLSGSVRAFTKRQQELYA